MLPPAVADLYQAQQVRIAETTAGAHREWRKINSWSQYGRIATSLLALLGAAQLGAARDGAAMVPIALEQTGYPEPALGRVNLAALVGRASDGHTLESMLWLAPRIGAEHGGKIGQQLAAGMAWLDLAIQRQISDTGRLASGTAITATRNTGYVRYVNPPCCQDCAILAGRWYRHSAGFQRHHRCDCVHRPASSREVPAGYVDTVALDQIHDLTAAQRNAIADGADLNQVVNAYRGQTPSRRNRMQTTTEGTSRAGWYGRTGRGGRRLTPEAIYTQARSREEAVRLLADYGYLI